ncbi:hypothetical protein ACFYTQ_26715 [Nocardia sp. NPDC004068]|uniref:hypothetical protein n=1 Tax=Nocardia sp. NPDC004068 TaxID=3364303 RepID=UPI0036971A84
MRYRLDVVAATVADAVEHAGGWLFDRVMSGWEVTVLVVEPGDVRPLEILGVRMLALEPVLAAAGDGRAPQAVAVAGEVCERDPRARRGLVSALSHPATEVVMWGAGTPAGLNVVRHKLSVAARAFKGCALAAASKSLSANDIGATETFVRSPGPCRDLTPR